MTPDPTRAGWRLGDWLRHAEQQHPQAIAMGLERVQAVKERLGLAFDAVVVTVAGTNGKGSTCAMLESIALQAGWKVGLYTSPHLVHFEERCRLQGQPIDAAALLPHLEAVEQARGSTPLTYFEFTTLAILRALALAGLDLVILEVGLGGRLDAVNAVDADAVVITSIDLDHMELLGPDRESIGREKAHVMRRGRPAIVSDPVPPHSVVAYAAEVGADLWLVGRDFAHSGDRQQWNWTGRQQRLNGMAYPALRGANQLINAAGVLAVLEALRERLPMSAQAVRSGLALVDLPGRFQIVPGQPTLVLDVAHNPQSVATLAVNLDQMGFFPRTLAVLGAMADKDLAAMLPRMLPLVDTWYLCDLPTPRAASAAQLQARLEAASAQASPARTLAPVHCHGNPRAALEAALAAADSADRIVVFGSFYTVGGVLEGGLPRRAAPHLSR
ncbi:MAG: bifunctional tetrahydrofolate synthase/dihydrofolate synthase [Rubrivivax sp.]|jgi:dihydrofolate synthase/folylpolyglutamate synthase|nr:bifunctional tetrahydrofolate synthase/dihydrofolate synthase [Rubrivivax sp.]